VGQVATLSHLFYSPLKCVGGFRSSSTSPLFHAARSQLHLTPDASLLNIQPSRSEPLWFRHLLLAPVVKKPYFPIIAGVVKVVDAGDSKSQQEDSTSD